MDNNFWDKLPNLPLPELNEELNKQAMDAMAYGVGVSHVELNKFHADSEKQQLETLRDQAALIALQGILSNNDSSTSVSSIKHSILSDCFDIADAFISEKKRRAEGE